MSNQLNPPPATTDAAVPRPQVRLVLSAVLLVYLGQMTLNPIIAPLSRQVGLAEWQVGVVISVAALAVVVSSQAWGRRSQSLGRKPVLVAAMGAATAAMTLFVFSTYLGLTGVLTGTALFVVWLTVRGVVFGGAIAAVAPTAQAYIADVTPTETERVRGMAGVGAVQGIAMVGGAVLGGTLAAFGLMVPLVTVAVLLAAATALVALRLRKEERHELIAEPLKVRPLDPRVWPYLLAGFGMFTALGFIQVITGFLVQDRFGYDAETTALMAGMALLGAGLGMVLAQGVVVPRSGWSPQTLLRVGAAVALVGFATLLPSAPVPVFVFAVALVGLGLGIATPGYTAGPSMLMSREEQGGMAGLIGANNALTFVITPTLATALYGVWPQLPLLFGVATIGVVLAFVLLHPRFRPVR